MVITTSQCCELRSFGQPSWSVNLTRQTLQSVWHWSSSQELWKLETFTILGWTQSPISLLPANSQSRIGMIWMLTRSPKGQWCDYCKMQWGTDHWRGQTQAVWQITSKRPGRQIVVRHYCQACANYVQDWGSYTWTLREQIEYAQGKETLDVQLGEL